VRLRAAAITLGADVAGREAIAGLRDAGVPVLLLKGPALTHAFGSRRVYGDVDLLVPPGEADRAGTVLESLGFRRLLRDGDVPLRGAQHAHEWRRDADRASVDLHVTLSGAGVPPEAVWAALDATAGPLGSGEVNARVPAPHALALLVALHAAHHGPGETKPLADLERALTVLPPETWRAAAELATRLDARAAFAAGLRLSPAGRQLAGRLGLGRRMSPDVSLRAAGAPPPALGLLGLLESDGGIRAKAGLVARGLVPSPAGLRLGRPIARRGPLGLATAYVTHPLWLARHLPPSLAAVRRARRECR